jgi:hypothetical protein
VGYWSDLGKTWYVVAANFLKMFNFQNSPAANAGKAYGSTRTVDRPGLDITEVLAA